MHLETDSNIICEPDWLKILQVNVLLKRLLQPYKCASTCEGQP